MRTAMTYSLAFLFELSPIHDVSWGHVGRPEWSVTREEGLCFGEKDNGAALVLGKGPY